MFIGSKFQWSIVERAQGRLAVVERNGVIGKFLVGLVAFSGDQDNVARLSQCDGARDSFRAIWDGFEI